MVSENEANGLKIHFVFAVGCYTTIYRDAMRLSSFIHDGMKQMRNIEEVMVTVLNMKRVRLITNEAMTTKAIKEVSITDDLQSLFEDLRLGKERAEWIHGLIFFTYFLPKLTDEEMRLVDRKDTSYFETFSFADPDVDEAEMKLSESDSKFLHGRGSRSTFTISRSYNL